MSTRQRIRRAALAVVAALCGGLCLLSAVALTWPLIPAAGETTLLATLWMSGVAGFGLSIAACRVGDDSTEDPRYFRTIVRGLRAEWHHDHDDAA